MNANHLFPFIQRVIKKAEITGASTCMYNVYVNLSFAYDDVNIISESHVKRRLQVNMCITYEN